MTLKIKRLLLVEISFLRQYFLRYLDCLGETYSIDQAGL